MMSALRKRLAPTQLHHSAGHDPPRSATSLVDLIQILHGQNDHARKSVTRLDAFSKKHAHEIALDLIELLPKLYRQATVVFDAFVLPAQA